MRSILRLLKTVLLCAVLLCGCAPQQETPAEETLPADPLTGQELQYPGQRTTAVVIQNDPENTQQWGLGSAAVVIETQTQEGAPTDLCLVYSAVEAMPTVGPVTAGQDIFWRILAGQQVLPVQWGSNAYADRYLDYFNIRAVDALTTGTNAFACDETWNTVPLWRTSGKQVSSVLESLSISAEVQKISSATEETETLLPGLLPQAPSGQPEPDEADAAAVWIDFPAESATGFAYDAAKGTYGMSRADGTAQRDANTGKQAQFDNVIVLYSASSLRDDGKTLDYDLTMGGGVWLNGGRLWHITWSQGTDSTFAFYDSDGKQLDLCTGHSYLALLSNITGEEVSVFNSDGQNLLKLG